MRPWHAAAAALAAAALTAGGFGIAEATTSAIPPNTLHGCVTGTTRTLRYVYVSPTSGTTCPSGFQVIWPNGADNDPATTAGPGGLDTTIVTATDPAGSIAYGAIAHCPADHPYAISGGWHFGPGYGGISIQASEPLTNVTPGGWSVVADTNNLPAPLYVYALCAK